MMKNRTFAYLLLFLFSLLIVLPLLGCSSRKKTLEKTELSLLNEISLYSSGTSKTKAEIKTEANTAVKQVEKSSEVEYSGAPGDSLTVTEKDSQGKVVKETTYKGSGKLKTKNEEKQTDTVIAESKQENNQAENKAEIKKKDSQTKKEGIKKLNVEAKGVSFGFYIWLSIAVVIGIVLVYLNNRFKWLERVTTFIKK